MRIFILLCLLLGVCLENAFASTYTSSYGFRPLYRGARSQGMGGIGVALADDEQMVFMNPAALGRNHKSSFHLLLGDLTFSSDFFKMYKEGSAVTNKFTGDVINVVMDKNLYADAQLTPTLLYDNLAIAVIMDYQAAIYAQNKVLPHITLGYQRTNGVHMAYGFPVYKPRYAGGELYFGLGARVLNRRGMYENIPISEIVALNKDAMTKRIAVSSMLYGGDVGMQYVRNLSKTTTLTLGAAQKDVMFSSSQNVVTTDVGNSTAGIAVQYEYGFSRFTGAFDYNYMFYDADWRKKVHLGFEAKFPIVSVFAGLNQMYVTYGTALNFWLLRGAVCSYTEEQGVFMYQQPEQRWMIRGDLVIPLM